ncbi:MAG: hypothetical protein WAN42_23205, partial [Pseudolabrys sp.]
VLGPLQRFPKPKVGGSTPLGTASRHIFFLLFSGVAPLEPQGCHSFVLNLFRYRALVERFLRNGSSVALYLAQGLVTKHCRYLVQGASTLR